jgi:hypothetical protein
LDLLRWRALPSSALGELPETIDFEEPIKIDDTFELGCGRKISRKYM